MKKELRIYELFSGIGSQIYALKKISKENDFKVISLGACDFYIDAIISYMIINYGTLDNENKLNKETMANLLSKYPFSSDSKKLVSKSYFHRMKKEKLESIFPYLYGFVNNDYFISKIKTKGFERERARQTSTKCLSCLKTLTS